MSLQPSKIDGWCCLVFATVPHDIVVPTRGIPLLNNKGSQWLEVGTRHLWQGRRHDRKGQTMEQAALITSDLHQQTSIHSLTLHNLIASMAASRRLRRVDSENSLCKIEARP